MQGFRQSLLIAKIKMEYAFKITWHGFILFFYFVAILLSAVFPFLGGSNESSPKVHEDEDSWELPDPGDTAHPNWHLYYKDDSAG